MVAHQPDFGTESKIETWHIDQLIPYDRNPRKITPAAVQKVARSIAEFGFNSPIIVDDEGVILAGHTRREALIQLGATDVAVIVKHGLTDQQKRAYRIMDNRAGEESEWDTDKLKLEMIELQDAGDFDLASLGLDSDEINALLTEEAEVIEPPKAAKPKKTPERALIEPVSTVIDIGSAPAAHLLMQWFSPPGGIVIDLFAGNAERGLLASRLGRAYHGLERDGDMVQANVGQLDEAENPAPTWYHGDPLGIGSLLPRSILADMVFVDPPVPFGEGESLLEWHQGMNAAIEAAVARLKPCRFLVMVAGDVRTPDDMLAGVPWRLVDMGLNAGLQLYNVAVLIGEPEGPRIGSFEADRKLDVAHKTVLVFVKGDPLAAARDIGPPR